MHYVALAHIFVAARAEQPPELRLLRRTELVEASLSKYRRAVEASMQKL